MSHLETHCNMCLDVLMGEIVPDYPDLKSQRKILPVTAGNVVRG